MCARIRFLDVYSLVGLATLFALLAIFLAPRAATAGDDLPNLIVPNSKAAITISLPVPSNNTRPDGVTCLLKEVGSAADGIVGQWSKSVDGDGTSSKGTDQLIAIIPPGDSSSATREFQILSCPAGQEVAKLPFSFQPKDDATLTLMEGRRPVLAYNHGVITGENVPKNDGRRQRAGYVHPIWGLDGEVLTDDFPRDHYHHHGLFWAWPHVSIDGRDYDLWMGVNIRHKFVKWLDRQSGPVAGVLGVENGWYVGERKVMIERVWLRVFKADDNSQAIDVQLTWIPVERPVSLLGAAGKSYGGLTLRYNIGPKNKPTITDPKGVEKADLKIARLPWADMTAVFPKRGEKISKSTSRCGATVMVSPSHPDYPPTWLTRHYGILCVGWPGVKSKTFPVDKPFSLSYRVRIHEGTLDAKQLDATYKAYVNGETEVKWSGE